MKLFQQLPEVQKYMDPAEFVKDYEINEKDSIFASKSIYDKYFKDMNLKAEVRFKSMYGKARFQPHYMLPISVQEHQSQRSYS